MRYFLLLLFSIPVFVLAEDEIERKCYVSSCRVDRDGTVWCDNQQVNCCEVQAMTCRYAPGDKREFSQSALDCSAPTGENVDVLVTRKVIERSPPDRDFYERGINGNGADGGLFEKYTLHSTSHSWPVFDETSGYDY